METKNNGGKMRRQLVWWGQRLFIIVGGVVVVLAGFSFIPYRTGSITHNVNNAHQLVVAMKVFASDHDGKFPDELKNVVTKDLMSEEDFRKLSHIKLDGGRPDAEWIYIPGLTEATPDDHLLIVSPPLKSTAGPIESLWNEYVHDLKLPKEEVRIVGFNNAGAWSLTEAKFREYLMKTGQKLPTPAPANAK